MQRLNRRHTLSLSVSRCPYLSNSLSASRLICIGRLVLTVRCALFIPIIHLYTTLGGVRRHGAVVVRVTALHDRLRALWGLPRSCGVSSGALGRGRELLVPVAPIAFFSSSFRSLFLLGPSSNPFFYGFFFCSRVVPLHIPRYNALKSFLLFSMPRSWTTLRSSEMPYWQRRKENYSLTPAQTRPKWYVCTVVVKFRWLFESVWY